MATLSDRRWLAILLFVFAAVHAVAEPAVVQATTPVENAVASPARRNLQIFDQAWRLVNEKYFDAKFRGVDWKAMRTKYRPEAEKAKDEEALYLAINRMCRELKESHLGALTGKKNKERESELRAGVGIRYHYVEKQRVITEVIPGSPAEKAGVQIGWILVGRDGRPLDDKERTPFKSEPGREVTMEFLDADDHSHTLTMKAAMVAFEQKVVRELDDGVVYLRFDDFDRDSISWLSEQLKAHRNAPAAIIDLRLNHGGSAWSLTFSLGEVLDKRVSLGTFIRRNGSEREVNSRQWMPAEYAGRLVILVDHSSMSCAEIFPHVLQHNRRAIIVGRKTGGAVIVSRRYRLSDGGMLQIPVEDYVGLDGERLEGNGVTPDVVVKPAFSELRAGIDVDIQAALTELKKPGEPSQTVSTSASLPKNKKS